jgi:hypothetical protein
LRLCCKLFVDIFVFKEKKKEKEWK